MTSANRTSDWRDEVRYCLLQPSVRIGLACVAIAALGLAVTTGALWWPVQRTHSRLEANLTALRTEIAANLRATELLDAYRQGAEQARVWETRLHHAGTQSEVIALVSDLARRHRLTLVSQALREDRQPSGVTALHQDLVLEGPYAGMRAFLAALPGLPGWTRAQVVQMEPSAHGKQAVRASLQLVTYHEPGGAS
ncbi:MAG TPA: hypothetical protein VKB51_11510 [bacterium]|nr:hypothetical protein [bacterium]